jgi:hypothetical protein
MLQVRGIILNGEMLFRGFDDWSDEEKNTPWFCLPTKHIHNALFFFSFCLPKKKQKGPRKPIYSLVFGESLDLAFILLW